jgi:SHS2 domain-containing protein
MYEIVEHTADVGLKIKADSLESAFVDSAQGLFDVMVETRKTCVSSIDVPIALEAATAEDLFINWLKELLLIFETRRLVLTRFWFDELSENRLIATVSGSKFDSAKHVQKMEINAATYHDLSFVCKDGEFLATILFDV